MLLSYSLHSELSANLAVSPDSARRPGLALQGMLVSNESGRLNLSDRTDTLSRRHEKLLTEREFAIKQPNLFPIITSPLILSSQKGIRDFFL